MVDDGYIINGFWKYATGAPYATVFTANCKIEKDGVPVIAENGETVVRSFFFKKEDVKIHYDWNTMGLKATASQSFSIHNQFVKSNRSFIIDAEHATIQGALYQYPFLQFAETTLAVNMLGMALHFLDECKPVFDNLKIDKTQKQIILNEAYTAKENIENIKENFYNAVNQSWQEQVNRGAAGNISLNEVSAISRALALEARNIVAKLYPYCGLSQTKPASAINRIFRDVFTASQHRLLSLPASPIQNTTVHDPQ